MPTHVQGLHHVTAMASDAAANNRFFTRVLGLRRVKKTVNFDAPDVYHLYYGDRTGAAGSIMTYFPFPNAARGRPGAGEVAVTAFSAPAGSLDFWERRLVEAGVTGVKREERFGETRLRFEGPDGDGLALVETSNDPRAPWDGGDIGPEHAIRGFHSVSMQLNDAAATAALLTFMGYEEVAREGAVRRLRVSGGNGADLIDIETQPLLAQGRQGAGSVHHIAFAVENREQQAAIRQSLADAGVQTTPSIDRDYFWAIYFRSPGGVLFEIATNEPGFARDEDVEHLGAALKLPTQHESLRPWLEQNLQPIGD